VLIVQVPGLFSVKEDHLVGQPHLV
jgi:hypothetical protein